MIYSKDHLGNYYKSLADMARAHNLAPVTLANRLNRGMTIEDALTTPVREHGMYASRECYDHLGNKYPSYKARANAYGKHANVVKERLAKGYTLEDALTIPTDASHLVKPVTDHLGNTYPTCKEMCDHYHIKMSTFCSRRYHMNLEEALTTPIKDKTDNNRRPCKDHLGNLYRSRREMCEHYGLTYDTVFLRLKRGMTLEEALTKKVGDR